MTSHDKHSNNSDTSQDLLALKRRGIDPFDGIDDDKGSGSKAMSMMLNSSTIIVIVIVIHSRDINDLRTVIHILHSSTSTVLNKIH